MRLKKKEDTCCEPSTALEARTEHSTMKLTDLPCDLVDGIAKLKLDAEDMALEFVDGPSVLAVRRGMSSPVCVVTLARDGRTLREAHVRAGTALVTDALVVFMAHAGMFHEKGTVRLRMAGHEWGSTAVHGIGPPPLLEDDDDGPDAALAAWIHEHCERVMRTAAVKRMLRILCHNACHGVRQAR